MARIKSLLNDKATSAEVCLSNIAAEVGVSRFHLIRMFRNEAGTTPHAYLVGRRIEVAKRRLRKGEAPIRVAATTGFADQAHLTRVFKARVGVTPGAYRDGGKKPAISETVCSLLSQWGRCPRPWSSSSLARGSISQHPKGLARFQHSMNTNPVRCFRTAESARQTPSPKASSPTARPSRNRYRMGPNRKSAPIHSRTVEYRPEISSLEDDGDRVLESWKIDSHMRG